MCPRADTFHSGIVLTMISNNDKKVNPLLAGSIFLFLTLPFVVAELDRNCTVPQDPKTSDKNQRLNDPIEQNITALWEAVQLIDENNTEIASGIIETKKHEHENEVKIDLVDDRLDDAAQTLNETVEMLSKADKQMEISITDFGEDDERFKSTVEELSDYLASETMNRTNEDQMIEAKIDEMEMTSLSIGTIIPWVKAPLDSGLPSVIPEGYVKCDGQTIVEGPWKGFKTPNLNDGRFLCGGNDNETWSLEDDVLKDHEHIDIGHQHYFLDIYQSIGTDSGASVEQGTHFEVSNANSNRTSKLASSNIGKVKLNEYGQCITADETRPKNMKVVMLIKTV